MLGDGPDADVFAAGLRPDGRAQLRGRALRPPRAADPGRAGRGAQDRRRRSWRPGWRRSAPGCWPSASKRPAPLRDDKVLTGWNGLMIAAYADGYRVLKVEKYRQAAETAADFLLRQAPHARRPPAADLPRWARPSSRPTWRITPSWPTGCSGSTPRPATPDGCARPGPWPTG